MPRSLADIYVALNVIAQAIANNTTKQSDFFTQELAQQQQTQQQQVAVTLPFVVSKAVADGATENAATIAAEIAGLGAQGGTIWFKPGTYRCTNLSVPGNITLRGSHSISFGPVTRLQAQAGSNLPVLSIKGVQGGHLLNVMLIDLSIYGDGSNNAPVVDTAFTTYLRFYRCHIGNSLHAGLQLLENWDSRIIDCDFEFCGSLDGSKGCVNCIPGPADNTNSLVIADCRFESFFVTAINASGNANKIYLSNNKMESSSRSPFINLSGCTHVSFDNQQLSSAGSGGNIPEGLVKMVSCYGVFGHVSMEAISSRGITVTNFMKVLGCECVDMKLLIMPGASEPSGGKIISYDGLHPATCAFGCQSQLTSPIT